jgi:ABC-2 type transport system ATP-binding protein
MIMGLNIENISKSYSGKRVVNNLSFKMDKPGVFGLLGRNGSGKTTTIRMMLGIINKEGGSIEWNGHKITRENVSYGYLPEERGIYPKAKIGEQLLYFAELKGMSRENAKKAIDHWAKILEVSEYLDQQAEKLSKGNQQKIQFMTVLTHDPELIILDEPFSGLDPINAEIIKNIIVDLVKKGKYIILSSHQMNIIEEFCTEILILDKGNTIIEGNLKEIKQSYGKNTLFINTNNDIDKYLDKKSFTIVSEKDGEYEIKFNNIDKTYELLKDIIENKIQVDKFEIKEPSLNEIFIDKVGKN